MTKITDEIKEMFSDVRKMLGGDVRSVELTDDTLCALLNICMGDYMERVENEAIANNWMGFYGKNISSSKELTYAFTMRSLDMAKDYSYCFPSRWGFSSRDHGN